MDDEPNQELRQQLAHKPPGEPLSLAEIRELKKTEAERVNRCIDRGLRPEDQSQVWQQLFAEGRCLPAGRFTDRSKLRASLPTASESAVDTTLGERDELTTTYVTGLTALNIPWPDRHMADWHSQVLTDPKFWLWSGCHLTATNHLLGDEDVYDVTEILRRYAPDTPENTFAAGYDRAVFDLIHHFTQKGKPVPNIQYKDIDDAIDAERIKRWIEVVDLPAAQKATMLDWFWHCE